MTPLGLAPAAFSFGDAEAIALTHWAFQTNQGDHVLFW